MNCPAQRPSRFASHRPSDLWICGRFPLPLQDDRVYWATAPDDDEQVHPEYVKTRRRHATVAEMKRVFGDAAVFTPREENDDEG